MKTNLKKLLAAVAGIALTMSVGAGFESADAGTMLLKQRGGATVVGGNTAGHSTVGGFAIPFQATCAPGFSKAGEKKVNTQGWPNWMDWYVCTTPVLTCPKQLQSNGLYSGLDVKAIVQIIGGDPDGGTVKFRVQYKCDYSQTVLPEG